MANGRKCGSIRTNSGAPCGRYASKDFFPYCSFKHDMTICGSIRTESGAPCRAYASENFYPYCRSKHDMTRPVQTHSSVLRLDNLRANMLEDLWQKTGQRDSYSGKRINPGKSEVDHIIELHLICAILDEQKESHRKEITPFVRDHLANDMSNLALTSHDTNIDKYRAVHACSEDRKVGNVNPAGLTHYIRLEFDDRRVETRRKITANIKKEIVRTYDDQQKFFKFGLKPHDEFSSKLHDMLVDFKVFE